ncbi:MAG: oligosaccharide flippase family protein [Bacteroidales bacterium]|nr:oligosaccharide flippase family protein [Bacteroidales bacterium]
MKKKLFSGLFWVLLLNLIVKPFWILGIDVGVQNAVGAEMYGFYFTIFNITYIFNILLDLGVTNFNTRNIARNPMLIRKHLSGILSIKLILLVLYAVVTFSVGLLMGFTSHKFLLLAWLVFNQFLNSLILYLRSNFEGLLLFRWDSVLSVLDRVLMIVICGFLLWGRTSLPFDQLKVQPFQIEWFVYAQTAAYLVTAVTALAVLVRKTGFARLRFNRPFTAAILKRSAPFALLVLLMASYNRIDPVLLGKLTGGDYQPGVYAGAFKLLDALTMIAYLVSVPLLPIYSKMLDHTALTGRRTSLSAEAHEQVASTTWLMTSLMWVFALTAAVTLASISSPLMQVLYPEADLAVQSDYAGVFRILIFGIVPIAMSYIFGTLLTANGSLRALNIFAATALCINIIVNLLLIPRWGALGSACASLSAQTFMAVAQICLSMKLLRLRLSWGYILKLALFTLCIVLGNLLAPAMPWWLAIVASTVVALLLAIVLKLINIKEIITTILIGDDEKTADVSTKK